MLSLTEAASLMGCHVETLRRAIRTGELKAARISREYKISKIELAEYFARKGGGKLFED